MVFLAGCWGFGRTGKNTSVSRFQEKEKRGEMKTKNDNINNIQALKNDNLYVIIFF
jgi:hypothetical protein